MAKKKKREVVLWGGGRGRKGDLEGFGEGRKRGWGREGLGEGWRREGVGGG